MVAFTEIQSDYDIAKILLFAGCNDSSNARIYGTRLEVLGVSQDSLDSAINNYNHSDYLNSIDIENKIKKIIDRLSIIDLESVRPLRSKISGAGTSYDDEKLAILDSESKSLRAQLSSLKKQNSA